MARAETHPTGNHTAKHTTTPPPSRVQVVLTGGKLRADLNTAIEHICPLLQKFHVGPS